MYRKYKLHVIDTRLHVNNKKLHVLHRSLNIVRTVKSIWQQWAENHKGDKKCTQNFWGNLLENDHLGGDGGYNIMGMGDEIAQDRVQWKALVISDVETSGSATRELVTPSV
jgi:hypothetical protein